MRRAWSGWHATSVAPVAFALFAFVGGEVVRRLWNWLLPSLFGVPAITFWQALGTLGAHVAGGARSIPASHA